MPHLDRRPDFVDSASHAVHMWSLDDHGARAPSLRLAKNEHSRGSNPTTMIVKIRLCALFHFRHQQGVVHTQVTVDHPVDAVHLCAMTRCCACLCASFWIVNELPNCAYETLDV